MAENTTGLLITLDEIHQNQIGELPELATTVQHAFREGRELVVVGAGLTSAIRDVVNDEVLTSCVERSAISWARSGAPTSCVRSGNR